MNTNLSKFDDYLLPDSETLNEVFANDFSEKVIGDYCSMSDSSSGDFEWQDAIH